MQITVGGIGSNPFQITADTHLGVRDRPRFFDHVGHQTTNASIENKHFFTK